MRRKSNHSFPIAGALTSRREVLCQGAALAAVTAIAPMWTRVARAQSATTFDYYISTTGSDSNPGTLASPWALTAINSKRSLYGGKRLGIIAGTYDCLAIFGGSYASVGNRTPAYNIQGGSASSPTYIASSDANGNYSPRVAILNGNSNEATNNPEDAAIIGFDTTYGAGYVVFDGLEVYGGSLLLTVWCGTNITVKNCHMHDCTTSTSGNNPALIWGDNLSYALIQNNYLEKISAPSDSRSPCSAVQCYASNNVIMEYNTVVQTYASQGNGLNFKDPGQFNNVQRYNFVYMPLQTNTQVQALGTDSAGTSADYFDVYNNIVVAQGFTVDDIGGEQSPWPPANVQRWYNNTFVGNPNVGATSGAGQGFYRAGAAGTINYYNNIIQRKSSATRGDVLITDVSPAIWDYNIYPMGAELKVQAGDSGVVEQAVTAQSTLSVWQTLLKTLTSGACIGQDAHSTLFSDANFGGSSALFQGSVSGSGLSPSSPGYYQLVVGAPGSATGAKPGSSNGEANGAAIDMGAWGGIDVNTGKPIAQIGCSFAPGSTSTRTTVLPAAPVLSVS